jgi:Cu/Ag efflux pump CusA
MYKLNHRLFQSLGITGLAFLVMGLVISFGFSPASLTILIDRSYCPASQWQGVVARYEQIYQQREVKLKAVVLFSDLGEQVRSPVPVPSEIASLSTYGKPSLTRRQELQQHYPNSKVLGCQ